MTRRVVSTLTSALLGLSLLFVPRAAMPAEAVQAPCLPEAANESDAVSIAERCGVRVEVLAGRTENGQTYANPDGTWTSEQALRPRFAKDRNGSWVKPDPTLVRNSDGTWSPRASMFPIALSGGGAALLAQLSKPGGGLSLAWPTSLPTPEVSGTTAIYREVQPGVDLRMVSDVDGVSQLLVVKTPAAAVRLRTQGFDLAVSTDSHLRMTSDAVGATTVKDKQGRELFTSASTRIWDSSGDGRTREPKEALVGVARRAGGQWQLSPDQVFLADPNLVYPLIVDPDFSGTKNHWALLRQTSSSTSYYDITDANISDTANNQSYGLARVGRSETGYTDRSVFQLNTAGVNGKHVLAAKFTLFQRWAGPGCSSPSGAVGLFKVPDIGSGTNWSNHAGHGDWYGTALGTNSEVHRNATGSSCPSANVEFGLTHAISTLGLGSVDTVTLGLRGMTETNQNTWKRYSNNAAASPFLTITYNSWPTVGARSTSPATPCVTGNGMNPAANLPKINDPTPDLFAIVNDLDTETDLRGRFDWQRWTGMVWGPHTYTFDATYHSNGTTTSITLPTLPSGQYRWSVTVFDALSPTESDQSTASGYCEFEVDVTPPPSPGVSSVEYPLNCDSCGGIGTTGQFQIISSDSDVDGYFWGFSMPPANWVPVINGASHTIDWTPTTGGLKTLYVKSHDRAGFEGPVTSHNFTVAGALPMRASWRLAEQPDDDGVFPEINDNSGNALHATLVGGGAGIGRVPGLSAITFDGIDDRINAAGPIVRDTTRSYSVSAWVNLASEEAGAKSVVRQMGTNSPVFELEYINYLGLKMWKLFTASQDSATATKVFVASAWDLPKIGKWTHLVGVFDSGTRTIKLYVDGSLIGSVSGVTAWDANGAFVIGGGTLYPWHGSISDVKVWERVLFDSEIRDMADPTALGNVGEYHFNETGSNTALDSSNFGHSLTLAGGASIPTQGAGHDGPGLLLMDGTGVAMSDGPSIFTSQSFTVSTWVRIDGTSLPSSNLSALGQSGENMTSFQLGYAQYGSAHWWHFSMPGADVAGGGTWSTAMSSAIGPEVLGKWVHLMGTYDATTDVISLYVNGGKASDANRSTPEFDTYGPLTVGAVLSTVDDQLVLIDHWVGAIDEVRIHQGVVPIAAGDWRFDSCTGNPVRCADTVSPGHELTLSGDAAWTASGHLDGSGVSFNGTGSGATTVPVVDTTKSFTVSAWVKLDSLGDYRCAVCFDGNNVDSFVLGYNHSFQAWGFWGHDVDQIGSGMSISVGGAPTLNQWTHLTGVYDAISGQIRLYVNGQLAAQTPYASGWQANGPLSIGRGKIGGFSAFWRGGIDDIRVYPGVIADPTFLMN